MAKNTIKVKIRDTESVVYEGEVERISSFNEVGRFDVFPMHANFITVILHEVALYQHREKIKEIKLEQAVMKVKKDEVHVFLGIEALVIGEQ